MLISTYYQNIQIKTTKVITSQVKTFQSKGWKQYAQNEMC